MKTQGVKGFTLLELLVVVAVIGIIVAIAVPNLLSAIERGKQKRTMADLRSLGTSMAEYSIDNSTYPVATTMSVLSGIIAPSYIRIAPQRDGWGTSFFVDSGANEYTLGSCGKGAVTCSSVTVAGIGGTTTRFTDDIVFSNGTFVQWPEGQQN